MCSRTGGPIEVLYVLKYRFVQRNSITVRNSLVTHDEIVGVLATPGQNHLAVSFRKLYQSWKVVDADDRFSRWTGHRFDVYEQLGITAFDFGPAANRRFASGDQEKSGPADECADHE